MKNWYINFSAWFRAVGQKFTKWGVGHTFFGEFSTFLKVQNFFAPCLFLAFVLTYEQAISAKTQTKVYEKVVRKSCVQRSCLVDWKSFVHRVMEASALPISVESEISGYFKSP